MIVAASNDNESSQVTLPGFSICVLEPVVFEVLHVFSQWLRSLRLKTAWLSLTRLKTAWLSLTVWQFLMKRAKEANIIATRISIDVGFRELKFGKFASYRRGV